MEVNGDVVWRLVTNIDDDMISLVKLQRGTGRLAIDQQHLSREAIWSMAFPRYSQVELFRVIMSRRWTSCYQIREKKDG